jgi:hypothetical protein
MSALASGGALFDSSAAGSKLTAVLAPTFAKLALIGSLTGATTPAAPPSWLDWTSPDATKIVLAPDLLEARVVQSTADLPDAVVTPANQTLTLSGVCAEMRALIDLPVQDLARMVGVGRRQFYNLMNGETPAMRSSEDERHLRVVHDRLKSLSSASSGASSLRSAVLTPLTELGGKSFYDAAHSGDASLLEDGYEALMSMFRSGSKFREQLPPSGTFLPGDPRWKDAAAVLFGDSAVE